MSCDRLRHHCTPDLRHPITGRDVASLVRTRARRASLALAIRVVGTRRDRVTGIFVEPMRVVPRPARLLLCRLELVRHPAGEPMPGRLARASRVDMAGAGAMADRLRRRPVRVAVGRSGVQTRARVVLT